ncbi:MAG: glycosyltransferase family 9 protein, partial [Candidatus Omnitrophica bacterium]|nr:glycosyltransferase family 9 protein [Candidatus Omnitrophota bacterium]
IFKALCYYPIEYLTLSRRNYGAGINCGQLPWTVMLEGALLNVLAIPAIVGFHRPDEAVLAMQHHTVNEFDLVGPSFYLNLLTYFDIDSVSSPELYFEVDRSSRDQLQRILKKIVGIDVNHPIAVVHPGGTPHHNSRRWPAEYYREVIAHLAKKNYYVFISGMGPHDAEVCDFVHKEIGNSYNLCNQLTFQQLAALIEKADICISNDTSVVHLAAAVKCTMLIAIYGPTNSAFLARTHKKHFIVTSDLECIPCRKSMLLLSLDEPCARAEKMECLKKIKPAQVIKLIDEHIHDRRGQ